MHIKYLIVGALSLALLSSPALALQGEKVTGTEAESVRQAITDYIQRDIKLKGGFFLYDPELKRVVGLKFDHVHEGVTRTAEGQFFACVDMRSVRGPLYDLDVYLEQGDQGLKPAKLIIHKVDGEKRK
jgi:opacity protein-like surface antigen